MPLYEYECQDCHQVFETIRLMNQADEPIPCAACGGQHTRRKLSLFFAESGGKAVAGTSTACNTCSGGNCSHCGY